ncbi:MAG: FAD-dependent oxidoreductase, partial [bacterium]|nr:FAD-dependent oxidoreductase [bacterium]
MMDYIIEPEKKLPLSAQADVVVLGGGPTGVCAAAAAARQGASVILIEKNGYLGGVCTAGLVGIWHSLYDMGRTEKIIGGLIDDIIGALQVGDALYFRSPNGDMVVDTELLKLIFDNLVLGSGADLLFHSYVAGA